MSIETVTPKAKHVSTLHYCKSPETEIQRIDIQKPCLGIEILIIISVIIISITIMIQ